MFYFNDLTEKEQKKKLSPASQIRVVGDGCRVKMASVLEGAPKDDVEEKSYMVLFVISFV